MIDPPLFHNLKHMIVFTLDAATAPTLTASSGEVFVARRVELSEWPTSRASVKVTGPMTSGRGAREARSAVYTLFGYERYRQCPDWLVELVRVAGYRGEVKRP